MTKNEDNITFFFILLCPVRTTQAAAVLQQFTFYGCTDCMTEWCRSIEEPQVSVGFVIPISR